MNDSLTIDKILSVADKPAVGANADSLTSMFTQIDNIIKQGDKILKFVENVEKSPIVSLIVKSQAAKAGVTDYHPLRETAGGIVPASDDHREAFDQLNRLTPEQLRELIAAHSKE